MKAVLNSVAAAMLLALLAGAPGCAQVPMQSHPYVGVEAFAPTQPDTVQILRTAPTQPSLRLGEISVEPKGNTGVAAIEKGFRDAAAKMGANAVLIVADRTELMGIQDNPSWNGPLITPVTGRVIVGIAIRYTSGAQPQIRAGPGNDPALATAARSGADEENN